MNYQVLEKIKSNNLFDILVIEDFDRKYILKKITNNNMIVAKSMLQNEKTALAKLSTYSFAPKLRSLVGISDSLVEDYVEGDTLITYKWSDDKEKISIFYKIMECVNTMHKNKIIHCDLKPENICIDKNKNIVILDYGIAKINDSYKYNNFCSPTYCSKEQVLQQEITTKTDVYSLCIILYVLLFKQLPFDGSKEEIVEKKKKGLFEKTNDEKANEFFTKVFTLEKYMTIDELLEDEYIKAINH